MAVQNQKGSDPVPIDSELLNWAEYWYPISWKGLLVAGIITAMGACLTIAFLLLQWRTTGIREEHSEWRIAELNTETAKLSADAEASRAAIADANARALEAQLALEKFKTPRSLNAAQQERVTAKLKPFAGLPFDFLIQTDSEPIALMEQIGSALKAAGLRWKPWTSPAPGTPVFTQPGIPHAGIVAFTGLMIQIDNAKTPQWGAAVVAIREALQAEGVETDAKGITDGTVTPNAIHIYVGRKPQ